MKEHVEISHLITFHALRVNKDLVIDLETWFKIPADIQISHHINSFKNFLLISVILLKMGKQINVREHIKSLAENM